MIGGAPDEAVGVAGPRPTTASLSRTEGRQRHSLAAASSAVLWFVLERHRLGLRSQARVPSAPIPVACKPGFYRAVVVVELRKGREVTWPRYRQSSTVAACCFDGGRLYDHQRFPAADRVCSCPDGGPLWIQCGGFENQVRQGGSRTSSNQRATSLVFAGASRVETCTR
jgi:hypothetical protein